MRGLSRGEASTATNPVLQLFTRQGEMLQDPVEGSFIIQDIRDPDAAPIERVASTSLNLNSIDDPSPGYKLGTGRFYIPTGATASWGFGTHRAVCTYKMVAGGRDYSQVIEFEVLNPTVFPTGQSYVGYASTSGLYADGVFSFSAMEPQTLHAQIKRVSLQLENLLNRFFEPRYLDQRISGDGRNVIHLDEAIVAIEQVATVDKELNGETLTVYSADTYSVMNRHLDGLLNPDDRDSPSIESIGQQVNGFLNRGRVYPSGDRNISVSGVFGFTDPEPNSDGVLIGETPDELAQVVGILVARQLEDPTLTSPATWQPGLIKMYKTRDQQIQFYGASGNVNYSGGITGDSLLDQRLLRFVKPARLDFPERKTAWWM